MSILFIFIFSRLSFDARSPRSEDVRLFGASLCAARISTGNMNKQGRAAVLVQGVGREFIMWARRCMGWFEWRLLAGCFWLDAGGRYLICAFVLRCGSTDFENHLIDVYIRNLAQNTHWKILRSIIDENELFARSRYKHLSKQSIRSSIRLFECICASKIKGYKR